MAAQYGVQAAALSKAIHVGRLASDGRSFTDKADLTAEVLAAVADWVQRNHKGSAWVTVGDVRLDIDVTNLADLDTTGADS